MLDVSQARQSRGMPGKAQPDDKVIDLHTILGFVRRERFTILGCVAAGLALALVYLVLATPSYLARADVFIDTRRLELFRDTSVFQPDQQINTGAVESQITVMTSNEVLGRAVDALKLTEDPDFFQPSLMSQVRGMLSFGSDEDEEAGPADAARVRLGAINRIRRDTEVKRVGLSYVISIEYASSNPALSAKIANGIANAYIQDQLTTRSNATEWAGEWLRQRLDDLRKRSFEADMAVQAFAADNNLLNIGRGSSVRRVSDQQVEELTSQLSNAQSQVADKQSQVNQIDSLLASGSEVVGVPQNLNNDILSKLRQEYLDMSRQEIDISTRYGEAHITAVNLRSRMDNIQKAVRAELQRMAEVAKSELSISQAREAQTRKTLQGYIADSNEGSKASIQLRELESTANSYRSLYENFLSRYMQAAEQQTFSMTDARIITSATPPGGKSSPKTSLVLAGGLILGLGLGGGLAILRALLDRVIRTTHQVETITGAPCLGILPRHEKTPLRPQAEFNGDPDRRIMRTPSGIQALAVSEPSSHFAETTRAIKVAVDLAGISRETKVIGIISSVASEGKSTVAINLAQIMSQSGKRVLLIDGDLRNPTLTRELAPKASVGLIEVMRSEVQPASAAWQGANGGFDFLPAVPGRVTGNTSDVLASPAMNAVLTAARSAYDYTIIDLAPVLASVDARAAAMLMDAFIMVVEWGETPAEVLTEAVSTSMIINERLLGTVLNKADIKVMRSFEHVPDTYY